MRAEYEQLGAGEIAVQRLILCDEGNVREDLGRLVKWRVSYDPQAPLARSKQPDE
jgi:hypothetical protein